MLKKAYSSVIFVLKSMISPNDTFPVIAGKPWIATVFTVLVTQLILSSFAIIVIAMALSVGEEESVSVFVDVMLGSIAAIPFLYLVPCAWFGWLAKIFKGEGGFWCYYRLISWSVLLSLLFIIVYGSAISLLSSVVDIPDNIMQLLLKLQVVPLVAYVFISMKIAYSLTWTRTLVVHSVGCFAVWLAMYFSPSQSLMG